MHIKLIEILHLVHRIGSQPLTAVCLGDVDPKRGKRDQATSASSVARSSQKE